MNNIIWKVSENIKENGVESSKKFTSKTHNNKSMMKINKFWINKQLCDVKLLVERRELSAHRNILAINSDYFEVMFSHWYEENHQETINLEGLVYDAVYTLLEFMYTGILSLTTDNVEDVFIASDLLQMKQIKDLCSSYLEETIDASNCLGMMRLGETYSCEELYNKSIQLIKLQFTTVCHTEEFHTLPINSLLQILSFDDLSLGSCGEELILNSVISWLQNNSTSRLVDISLLFSHVKLKCVDPTVIQNLLNSSIYVGNEDLRKVIINQLEGVGHQTERKPVQCIYVVGGFLQSRTGPYCPRLKTVEKYNIQMDRWDAVSELSILPSATQIIKIHGRMFVSVFEQLFEDNNNRLFMLEYDPLQNKWKDAVNYFSKEVCLLIHDCNLRGGVITTCQQTNNIYVLSDKSVHLLQVELCDSEIMCNKITNLPKVSHFEENKNRNYCCIMCDDYLYVFGGDVRYSELEIEPISDVWLLDDNQWLKKANMQEPRSQFAVVALDTYIYALGGFNTRRVNTVERYDCKSDQWTYVSGMNKERSHLKAVVISKKIYVMGGKSYFSTRGGARKVLNMCEMYDSTCNIWSNIQPMKHSRCMFGAMAF